MEPEFIFVPSAFKHGDDTVKVFHAMGCRDGTLDQLR